MGVIPITVKVNLLTKAVAVSESLVAELISRMIGVPETVQMISAISTFSSARLPDFNASDDPFFLF